MAVCGSSKQLAPTIKSHTGRERSYGPKAALRRYRDSVPDGYVGLCPGILP
jgi:hypothetical protein